MSPANNERISRAGVVEQRRVRQTRAGKPYVQGSLVSEDGAAITVNWWNAEQAPAVGQRVAVSGKWSVQWESLSADETKPLASADAGIVFEHRLLGYYRACLEAEQASQNVLPLGGRSTLILESGPSPLSGANDQAFDQGNTRWIQDRNAAGAAETIYCGYPLVTGTKEGERGIRRVAVGLLTCEVTLEHRTDGIRITATSPGFDLNGAALEQLGYDREGRERLAQDFDALPSPPSGRSRLVHALAWLTEQGVLPEKVALPNELAPIDPNAIISNAAIVFVSEGDNTAINAALFRDFEALLAVPVTELQSGPLGVLLGHIPAEAPPATEPAPSPLPSNPQQERAITAAMHNTLSVVTGPPGTGKSQVLANAVAAALAKGETVLLASRNNQAIDVVTERIRSIDPAAAPVRLGRRDTRKPAAEAMAEALARPLVETSGLEQAKSAWARTADLLRQPLQKLAEREAAVAELTDLEQRCVAASIAVPELCSDCLLVERDLLTVKVLEVEHRLREADGLKDRWWWQRRRKRAVEQEATAATQVATSLVGESCGSVLSRTLVSDGEQAVLAVLKDMLVLFELQDERARAEARVRSMPSVAELEGAILASYEERRPVARELFASGWLHRLQLGGAPGRMPARSYQLGLAAVAEGESPVLPLRDRVPDALESFPVWAIPSLSLGSYLPMRRDVFDLVIIDEASQSDIASAMPILFRAKRAMIIGDPDQFTHITTVSAETDHMLSQRFGLDDEQADELGYAASSLYRLGARRMPKEPIFLDRHYRSDPQIIDFASRHVYGGRLRVMTSVQERHEPVLRWMDIDGVIERPRSGSARNRAEADWVVRELRKQSPRWAAAGWSAGVVTPYRAQAQLIREQLLTADPELHSQVRVGTAYSFQGDERDVMLFSPVITREATPFHQQFAGDRRLINVTVTRARQELIVVGNKAACAASGTLLAELANYIDAITAGSDRG